jgi:hypothetical protein
VRLSAFLEDAVDGWAGLATSGLAKEFEHLVETFDLALGFGAVLLESRGHLFGFCALRHFR